MIGSHTGVNIKKQYEEVTKEVGIEDKIIKIVTDQAANMVKAFGKETEANEIVDGSDIIELTKALLFHQKQQDLKEKEKELLNELNEEISEMNKFIGDANYRVSKKRDAVMAELDLEYDDFTDTESISDATEDVDSINDDEDSEDLNVLENEINKESMKLLLILLKLKFYYFLKNCNF